MVSITRDVSALDQSHRQAVEDLIGQELHAGQRLTIRVEDVGVTGNPPQTVEDWTRVYDGLSDQEIEEIDQMVKTRADWTRHFR